MESLLTKQPCEGKYYWAHFTEKETEAQGGAETCFKVIQLMSRGAQFKPGASLNSKAQLSSTVPCGLITDSRVIDSIPIIILIIASFY